jgi:hypothetical protein
LVDDPMGQDIQPLGLHEIGWGGRIRTSAWRNQNPTTYAANDRRSSPGITITRVFT